jgi:soluble lytic murein transglycosylase-like protein
VTTRSIIDIEVRDQAFKDFAQLFAKYQKQVENVPKGWDKVGAAIKAANTPFDKVAAGVKSTVDLLKNAHTAQEKFRLSAQLTGKAFGSMATGAGKLAKNIKAVTLDLLKWGTLTGVFSGLLGAGSLFGMDRLARAASTSRREAQGLGISPGEHEAAKVNYQKLVDVDSMLSKINEAKLDVTKRSAFSAAGLQPDEWENKNAADILKTLIPQMKKRFDEVGGTQQGAQAAGLTQFTDMDTLLRLKAVTREEIDATGQRYEADKKLLAVSDEIQRKWQDLGIQLQRSGSQIENSFIKGLAPLAPHIERLSAAVASAVDVFLASPKIGEWIEEVGAGLEKFAKYLTSDDLGHDIKGFLDAVDVFAGSLWGVAKTIGKVFNFGNEQGLRASQYRQLEQIDKVDHNLAKTLERVLKNPSAANKFSAMSLSTPSADLAQAMKDATPEMRALAQQLQNSTKPGEAATHQDEKGGSTDFEKALQNLQQRTPALGNKPAPTPTAGDKFSALEKQYNLPRGLLASVEKQESGGNPNARSPVGAEGAFQFMPAAWKRYGAGGDIHNEMDSAQAAAKYYHDLLDKFQGDLPKALAGYNWGEGNVDRKGLNAAPEETRNYVASIVADMNRRNAAPQAGSTSASYGSTPAPMPQRQQAPAPIQVNITKAAGADVNVQVNALSGVPG